MRRLSDGMGVRHLHLGAAFLLTVFLAARPAVASGQDVFSVDYENGAVDSDVPGLAAVKPRAQDAIGVSGLYAKNGQGSLRSKIMFSDDYVSDGAHRAESNTIKIKSSRYGEGDHFRYHFSVLLAPDWVADTRDSIDIIFQFKRFTGHPDMFVAVKGRDIVLRCLDQQRDLIKNYVPGQWMDFDLDVRWSSGRDGSVEASARGSGSGRTAALRGPNMPPEAAPRDAYLKWGLYKRDFAKSTVKNERVVYHDSIVVERIAD